MARLLQGLQQHFDTPDIRGYKVIGITAPDTTRAVNDSAGLGNDRRKFVYISETNRYLLTTRWNPAVDFLFRAYHRLYVMAVLQQRRYQSLTDKTAGSGDKY